MDDGSWRTLGREYVYRSPWCSFRVDEVRLPGGAQIEYGVLESGGFASVVPVTDRNTVVLVRQWRQPLGAFTLELPSGGVDAGEEPETAARRELFEETGYRAAGELERLASLHASTGRSTEVCHLFRCRAARDERGPRPEPTELSGSWSCPSTRRSGRWRAGRSPTPLPCSASSGPPGVSRTPRIGYISYRLNDRGAARLRGCGVRAPAPTR